MARSDARILILGSLPGRVSLQRRQYYAHPRNTFWRLVATVFGEAGEGSYARRTRMLTRNRIALWDVIAAARRPGSLDSSILHASARMNDFEAFFRAHPRIRRVFFNGRKAEQMYRRFVLPALGPARARMRYECLPSTSPAHAGMSFAKKLGEWSKLKERRK